MKIFILLTLTTLNLYALEVAKTTTAISTQTINTVDEKYIDGFAQKKLDLKTDLNEAIKVVEYLLKVDDIDPARIDAQLLSESYNKNKAVYDQAFSIVGKRKTREQQKDLKEIKQIMANLFNNGNG